MLPTEIPADKYDFLLLKIPALPFDVKEVSEIQVLI
jgi:hypothetical protein